MKFIWNKIQKVHTNSYTKILDEPVSSLNALILYKCPYQKIRIGSQNDGGYVIADLPGTYDMFLSGGVANDINFEKALLDIYPDLECHAYDGTIGEINDTNNRITFFKKNLGNTNTDLTTNWDTYLNKYTDIFIKMDIEGHEFKILPEFLSKMSNIKQLVFELHSPQDISSYPNYYKNLQFIKNKDMFSLLEMINKTHTLIHFHANNGPGVHEIARITIPNVFELTYIRNDYVSEKIQNNESLPTTLDMQNNPDAADIYLQGFPYSLTKL